MFSTFQLNLQCIQPKYLSNYVRETILQFFQVIICQINWAISRDSDCIINMYVYRVPRLLSKYFILIIMKIMRHLSPLDKSVTCMKQANFGQTPVWCPILPNKLESFFSFHIGWAPIGLPFSVEMCIVLTTEANSLACIFHNKTFFKKLLSSIFALPYFIKC